MRIVDERYKILLLEYSEPLYDEFLVEDLHSSQNLAMYVFKRDIFDDDFAAFMRKDFLRLSMLNNRFLEKSYCFKNIRSIDDSLVSDGSQLLLCEKIQNELDIFQYLDTCSIMQRIELFIEICRAVFFLHINDFAYSGLNLDSMLLFSDNGKISLKLKNLVMRKFSLAYKLDSSYRFPFEERKSVAEKDKDIYSLALVLYNILKSESKKDLKVNDIKNFTLSGLKNPSELEAIKALLRKIILFKNSDKLSVHTIVSEVSKIFNTNYTLFSENLFLDKCSFPKFIARKEEMQYLLSSSFKRDPAVKAENLFLLTGKKGIGKTRFLKELQNRMQVEGILVFAYYDIAEKNLNDLSSKFLEQTNLFVDDNDIQSFDISTYTEEKNESEKLLRFFEYAKKHIQSLTSNLAISIIIDDIELISEKDFLQKLFFFANSVKDSNLSFIFSYDDSNEEFDAYVLSYLTNIQKNNFYKKISLSSLSPSFTEDLITTVLASSDLPRKFTESVFLKSNGIAKDVLCIIEQLFKSKKLSINKKTSKVELSSDFFSEIKNDKLDASIILENLNKRVKNLSEYDIKTLKFFSIFQIELSESFLFNNKANSEKERITNAIEKLLKAKIIFARTYADCKKFFISDYILKALIVKNLSDYEKKKLHKTAAEQLQSLSKEILEKEYSYMEELAFHVKNAGELSKAKHFYTKLAIKYKKEKMLINVVDCLLKIVKCIDKNDVLSLTKVFLDLSIFYFETGDLNNSMLYSNKALNECKKTNKKELLLEVYVQQLCLADILFDKSGIKRYMNKANKIIAGNPEKYSRSQATIIRMKALSSYEAGKMDESMAFCDEAFKLSKWKPGLRKERSNTYRLASDILCQKKDFQKAQDYLNESIKISNAIGHTRGVLVGYIVFAFFYNMQNNRQKAIEYYRKAQAGSIKYKIINSELLANDYIALEYLNSGQYELAYRYMTHGFQSACKNKANESIYRLSILLLHTCLHLNYVKEARYYFESLKKICRERNISNRDDDFYVAAIQYHAYFNEYAIVKEYLEKIMPYDISNCAMHIDSIPFYLQLYSYIINPKKVKIETIIDLIGKSNTQKLFIEQACFAFFVFLKVNAKKAMREVFNILGNINESDVSTIEKNTIYFIRSFFEKKNSLNYLVEILKTSFKMDLGKLKIYTLFQIAQNFIKEKKYQVALATLIEANLASKQYLARLPLEKQYPFFTGEKLYIITENINAILKNDAASLITNYTKKFFTPNKKNYNSFLRRDFKKIISKNANTYYEISPELLKLTAPVLAEDNILIKLNTSVKNDINIFLRNIACEFLATEVFIVLIRNKSDIEIIDRYSYFEDEVNLNLFYKISKSSETVIVNKSQLGAVKTKKNIHCCMAFPIRANDESQDNNVIAYLYADSVYAINLIQEKAPAFLEKYKNLLGILVQSYSMYTVANVDKLTKALTKDALHKRLKEYSIRYSLFSLICYDIDSLQDINKKYSSEVANLVLSETSKLVLSKLSEGDFLGRQGGDKFVICLANVNSKDAFDRAEKIRAAVSNKRFLGYNFTVTISIGIATYGEHSRIVLDVLQKAERAMYLSKQSGKNKTNIWNESLKENIISLDGLSRIANKKDFWTLRTSKFITSILKLSNTKMAYSEILKRYLEKAKFLLESEFEILIFIKDKKILNQTTVDKILGLVKPFWFESILKLISNDEFIKAEAKIFSAFPKDERNAIFQNGVSLLLVPIIFRDEFLGLNCFITHRYIKEFSFDDASIQVFATNLLANVFYEFYKTFG